MDREFPAVPVEDGQVRDRCAMLELESGDDFVSDATRPVARVENDEDRVAHG